MTWATLSVDGDLRRGFVRKLLGVGNILLFEVECQLTVVVNINESNTYAARESTSDSETTVSFGQEGINLGGSTTTLAKTNDVLDTAAHWIPHSLLT